MEERGVAAEPLEYRPKVWKSLLHLFLMAAGIALCGWLFGITGTSMFGRLANAAGVALFAVGFFIVLRSLLLRRAFLRLDEQGILVIDHVGRVAVRALWTEVVDVYEGTAGHLPVVVLVAADTQAGLSEGSTAPLGIDGEDGRQTDPGFVINPAPFDLKPSYLVERIWPFLIREHSAQGDVP
jgi:hypothetical protein